MTGVGLSITQPTDGAWFRCPEPDGDTVRFVGAVTTVPPTDLRLYFRWYSSLSSSVQLPGGWNYSLNRTPEEQRTDPGVAFDTALAFGVHAITLTASDLLTEPSRDTLPSHGGAVGGGPPALRPCVIHVLRADLGLPSVAVAPRPKLSLSRDDLTARAPSAWPASAGRIGYGWRLSRPGGPSVLVEPDPGQLHLRDGPVATYPLAALPPVQQAALAPGDGRPWVLRLEVYVLGGPGVPGHDPGTATCEREVEVVP
jgi:hypothetical protein